MRLNFFKFLLPVTVAAMPGFAFAQTVNAASPDVSVLGLYIGQSEADSLRALEKSQFSVLDRQTRRQGAGRQDRIRNVDYQTEAGDRLSVKRASEKTPAHTGRIIAIDYAPARADDGLALEARLKSKFGAPMVVYTLGEDRKLYVWERPAPEQSRDLGSLMTVSLTTGEAPALKISQFSRPDAAILKPARKRVGRAAANPVRAKLQTGPID